MKKALYVATVDVHIRTFHLPYLKLLHDNGYEVHVATNGEEQFPNCDKKHNICIERSPFKLKNLKAIRELKRIIEREKYDLIHCHTPMGSVVTRLAARKYRKKYGTKVIYTAHGFHFYKGAPLLNWILFYPIEKWLAKYTDTLITINKEDYELAKNKFSKRCKDIQYVPGVGIDTKKFDIKMSEKEKEEYRNSIGLNNKDFVLTCVARLDKNKNQGFLINVMELLVKENKNYHLLLVGPDELDGYYQKMVNEKNLSKNIHFLGRREDIPQILKISNIVVSASLREGLPVNVIEAFSAGKPVVALKCRGMKDLISTELNGCIIKKGNICDFKQKIISNYNNNEKESKRIIENSKQYDISIISNIIKDIYIKKTKVLIIPNCTDLNRGDQALVLETKKIIEKTFNNCECYMMSNDNVEQCEKYGLIKFKDVLKHPSRFSKNKKNVKYGMILKIKWGIIATFDYIVSQLLLRKPFRNIIMYLMKSETKKSISIFMESDYVFVKGGGFLHDYSGGLIGLYTMYYQVYHIKLALSLNKKVFIMPNSFGPFKNKMSRRIVNNVIDKCTLVTARESLSSNGKTNGLGRNLKQYPDLGFYLKKKNNNVFVKEYLKKFDIDISKDKLVAITVRPYRFYSYDNPEQKYLDYKKSFVSFIEYLTNKNYKVLLVVHTISENDHENDEKCIDEIIKMIKNNKNVYKIKNNNFDCYDMKEIYGYCKYVVGTRFHSVIFSLEQLIPCIAITYGGNKGDGIMKDIGISNYAIKIGEMNSSILIERFNSLEKNNDIVKSKLKKYIFYTKEEYINLLNEIKNNI